MVKSKKQICIERIIQLSKILLRPLANEVLFQTFHNFQIPMADNDSSNETLTKSIQLSYNVTRLRRDPNYITLYVNWFLLLTTGIIPMGALIFLNSRIYAKILETRRLRERCRIRSSTVIALQARNADSTTTQGFIKQTLKYGFLKK